MGLEPHACACEGRMCSDMRDTTRLRKMCVRQGVLSTPSVAYKGIAISCKRNSLEKSANSPFCDLSIGDLAIGDLAIGDLAVGCLGVHAIESLEFVLPPIL